MKENFNLYESEGISVYIQKTLEAKENSIKIKLSGLLWLKSFEVTGFKVL